MEEKIKLLNSILPNHENAFKYRKETIEKLFSSEYQVKAINFLAKTKTTCQIDPIGQSIPSWGKQAVNTYSVTLKNARGEYTFTFYDSISNTEKKKSARLNFYSVLACGATVVEHNRDDKVIIFKKKRRHNYRRKKGHMQQRTVLEITDIAG